MENEVNSVMEDKPSSDDFWLDCLKCGHRWLRRKLDSLPINCPRCRNPKWQERKEEEKVIIDGPRI